MPGNVDQYRVARQVPLGVIDGLEVVEVDHHHGQRASIAQRTIELEGQLLVQSPSVCKPRPAQKMKSTRKTTEARRAATMTSAPTERSAGVPPSALAGRRSLRIMPSLSNNATR